MDTKRILSVSEYNRIISDYLEQGLWTVVVQGEVTGFRVARDRLVYFELKDEKARCLCFALTHEMDQPLEDGMEVKVTGVPKVFQSTGGLYLRVQGVELVGAGALQKAFEKLKKKLEAEGLFDARWKVPLPRFPESIGIITSPGAAAYTDILKRLHERWGGLTIVLAPVAVQGSPAPREMMGAIKYFNEAHPVDVVILTRGGGSIEDLQAFNSEPLARAVFASKIPIISGVGHERDVTLVDYVADVRASTPTNAAELVVPHRRETLQQLDQMLVDALAAVERKVHTHSFSLQHTFMQLWHAIGSQMQEVEKLFGRFTFSFGRMEHTLVLAQQRLAQIALRLDALSPRATLTRGYSITRHKGKILRDATVVSEGDILETELAKGSVYSRVT
jgi:exodeoxyribonuclease VII large subunit